MQLQAGYITDGLTEFLISSGFQRDRIEGLLESLSYFEMSYDESIEGTQDVSPIFAAAENIISRGTPTLANIYCEEALSRSYIKTERLVDDTGKVSYEYSQDIQFAKLLYRSLHIIDPRISSKEQFRKYQESWEKLGSGCEEDFLFRHVPNLLGSELIQLMETQKSFESILDYSTHPRDGFDKYKYGTSKTFCRQRVDFSIEFPYVIQNDKGIVIEIDGIHHQDKSQQLLDDTRDDAAAKAGWGKTIRIPVSEFDQISDCLKPMDKYTKGHYFKIIQKNYQEPLYCHEEGTAALEVALTPFAVARIQKAILHLINNNILSLDQPTWTIAIIERDVTCGYLAIEDLKLLLNSIFSLTKEEIHMPEIVLRVISCAEFSKSRLRDNNQGNSNDLKKYDLILDVSMLQRECIQPEKLHINGNIYVTIRSSQSRRSGRRIKTSSRICYKPVDQKSAENLSYLLQTIFRKSAFRPGQMEIIDRVLQLKNTVGLLPTGSGKSLTYQLSALLQPGVTLVVDPLKSLMKDQAEGLKKARIDACIFINSSIKSTKERNYRTEQMKRGEILFAFISPERLQIEDFRNVLQDMPTKYSTYFSYCVIDEVHCVSEWGHDFRTAYLRLGENALQYCTVKSLDPDEKITLLGLTATASFDVLADVQKELNLPESAIVSMDSADRSELSYRVFEIKLDNNAFNRKTLGIYKQQELVKLIESIPDEIHKQNEQVRASESQDHYLKVFEKDKFYDPNDIQHTGLIFCPHRTSAHGVEDISAAVRTGNKKIGEYVGGGDKNDVTAGQSEENQDRFINNELNILVATKAFGMGIDKPNIRFSVHFNFPNSIESYYQEAGRCGRDRKLALCYILFSGHPAETEIQDSFHNNSFKGVKKEKTIIIDELLTKITYPENSNLKLLNERIKKDAGINARCKVSNNNGLKLYVNQVFPKKYGYLDLINSLTCYPDARDFPLATSNQVLAAVRQFLEELVPKDKTPYKWLEQSSKLAPIDGIETQLKAIAENKELPAITIGFENGTIKKIVDLIKSNHGPDISEYEVTEAYSYCTDPDVFLNRVKAKADKKGSNVNPQLAAKIKELFWKIRDEQDTFKAVYRLSIVGVIEDYIIDYNSRTIILKGIRRKLDSEYVENLQQYILRYFSKERAAIEGLKIDEQEGDSVLQKCLAFLIHFIYQEIAKKRKEAIYSMRSACIDGAEKGPEEFREYLNLYFNSKYYKELKEKTNSGRDFNTDIVWEYIGITEGNKSDLKHLRGACIRLLNENPDNGAFHLLKSCATFLIEEESSRLLEDARASFHRGFALFQEHKAYDFRALIPVVREYCSRIIALDDRLKPALTAEVNKLFLKHHNKWLKEFNNKFMV